MYIYIYLFICSFICHGATAPCGLSPPYYQELTITFRHTTHSVGILYTSNHPDAETSTSQQTDIYKCECTRTYICLPLTQPVMTPPTRPVTLPPIGSGTFPPQPLQVKYTARPNPSHSSSTCP